MSLGNREDSGWQRSLSQKTCLLFIIQYHVDLGVVWQGPSVLFLAERVLSFPKKVVKNNSPQGRKEEKMESKNKRNAIAVLALVIVLGIAGAIYMLARPPVSAGEKHIVVEVIDKSGSAKEFSYDTDEEYLRGVLEGAGLIAGDASEYGLLSRQWTAIRWMTPIRSGGVLPREESR